MTVRTTADAEMTAMLSVLSGFERHFDDYYKIQERLHAGAYGTVYRVIEKQHRHQKPPKQFAAKIIPRRKLRKIEEQDMMTEADILRDVCGMENVVEFVDFFACDDYFIIVQILALGGDVFDQIARGQLYSEQDARSVAIKLLQTVKKLHDRDIVHRDIKLENLLLSNPDDLSSILLSDFGFATYLPQEGYLTRRCGTPAYCAPEVWKKQAYGKPCDMWSVGCALFILFAGRPPFAGRDNKEIYRKTCGGDLFFEGQQWESVSQEAKDCIRGLLRVDPTKRWTAKQALGSTWIQSGLTDALFQNLDWMPRLDASEMRDQIGRSYVISSVVPLNMG